MTEAGDDGVVAAYVPSMMDRSKVEGSLPATLFVAAADQLLLIDADTFVVDLMADGVAEVLDELVAEGRVVGFARHTSPEVIVEATAAGVEAMARSKFFAGLGSGALPTA